LTGRRRRRYRRGPEEEPLDEREERQAMATLISGKAAATALAMAARYLTAGKPALGGSLRASDQ